MGKSEARILRECFRWHRPVPEKIQNAPTLHMGLELFFDAFIELNTCRTVSWSAGPIPWSAVEDYARTFEFDDDQAYELRYHIRAMDQAFLTRLESKKGK